MKLDLIKPATEYCSDCEAELKPEDDFCPGCGSALEADESLGDKTTFAEKVLRLRERIPKIPTLAKLQEIEGMPKLPTATPALLFLIGAAITIPWCVSTIDSSYDSMSEDYIVGAAEKALKHHSTAEATELLLRFHMERSGKLTKPHIELFGKCLLQRAAEALALKDYTTAMHYLHSITPQFPQFAIAQAQIKELERNGTTVTAVAPVVPLMPAPGAPATAPVAGQPAAPGQPVPGAQPAGAPAAVGANTVTTPTPAVGATPGPTPGVPLTPALAATAIAPAIAPNAASAAASVPHVSTPVAAVPVAAQTTVKFPPPNLKPMEAVKPVIPMSADETKVQTIQVPALTPSPDAMVQHHISSNATNAPAKALPAKPVIIPAPVSTPVAKAAVGLTTSVKTETPSAVPAKKEQIANKATVKKETQNATTPIWQRISQGGTTAFKHPEEKKKAVPTGNTESKPQVATKSTDKQHEESGKPGFSIDGKAVTPADASPESTRTGGETARATARPSAPAGQKSRDEEGQKSYDPEDISRYNELLANYFRQHDAAGKSADKESSKTEPPSFREWISKGKQGFR